MIQLESFNKACIEIDSVNYKGCDISKLMYKKTGSYQINFSDIPYYFDKSKVTITTKVLDDNVKVHTDGNGTYTIETNQKFGTIKLYK